MIDQMLKIAKAKDVQSFYKSFPTEESFMKIHSKAFKKAQLGATMNKLPKAAPGFKFNIDELAGNNLEDIRALDNPSMQPILRRDQINGNPKGLLATQPVDNTLASSKESGSGLSDLLNPGMAIGKQIGGGVAEFINEKKKAKSTKTWADVNTLQAQAAMSPNVDFGMMNQQLMIRPEDRQDTGEEFFPINGVGTNVLAKNGKSIYAEGGGNFEQFMGAGGTDMANQLGSTVFENNAGWQMGKGVGSAVKMIPGIGPVVGAIAEPVLGAIGGALDSFYGPAGEIKHNQKVIDNKTRQMQMGNMAQGIREQYSGYLKNGGELELYNGEAEPISYNPYLPEGGESVMFRGPSHDNGGIDIQYGGQGVEVEGGEPAVKLDEGGNVAPALTVFGNLKPSKEHLATVGLEEFDGQKFKGIVKSLTEKTDKLNKLVDKSANKLDDHPMVTSFDKLGFDSWKANIMGADMQLKNIATKIENAGALQQAINDTASEGGYDADSLAKGKLKQAKFGKTIAKNGADDLKKDQFNILADNAQKLKLAQFYYNGKPYNTSEFTDPELKVDEFTTRGVNPGSIDYNPIAPDYNKDYWNSQENYKKNWIPKVEAAFSNPEQAASLISRIENYGGQDFADVQAALAKGKTPEQKVAIAKRLGTDMKIGPYHKLLADIMNPAITNNERSMMNPPQINIPADELFASIKDEPVSTKKKLPWMEAINSVVPYLRPNYQLDRPDLSTEFTAMGYNQLEPVQARQFQPQLDVPYDVSYQDLLNKNQGDFRAVERMAQNNPALLAQLNAQKYGANQQVLGEQFRQNQAMKDKVYSKNRDTLNQSQLTNLGIMDKQYERQTSAKAKTQEEAVRIASSISDKLNRYKMEQHVSDLEQQRYNYRFDSKGRPINMNPLAQWNMEGNPFATANAPLAEGRQYTYTTDSSGNLMREDIKSKRNSGRNGAIVRALKTI